MTGSQQLKRRNWKGEIGCQICAVKEDVDHIMFRCVISRYMGKVPELSRGVPGRLG
jgi:hypothetical protein